MSNPRLALRFIRTHPAFSCLVILSLALGIGLNSAIFSIVDGVLLRPLPYKDPDRLYMLFEVTPGAGGEAEQYNASYQDFLAWREQGRSFERLEAMESTFRNITGSKEPESLRASVVTDGFFSLLGARAALGRLFLAAEAKPGAPPVAVLGQDLWRRRFGADPGIVGRAVVLDGQSYTVVGVIAPGFYFMADADVWLPMPLDEAHPPYPPRARYLYVTGRLRQGSSLAAAQAEMRTIAARLAQEHPDTNATWSVQVVSLRENLVGDIRRALIVLMAAVSFVLLIACANVANLLLNRVAGRRAELAVRSALGAPRWRLVWQVVTESTVLALLGGALGSVLAAISIRLLPRLSPTQIPLLRDVHIDYRVLGFTLLISLLTGLFPGLLAALKGTRRRLYADLKNAGQRTSVGVGGRRLQGALVVAEVALTLMLLACSGLVLKSFERLSRTSPGFDSRNVLLGQITLPSWKYKEPGQIRAFWRNLLPRIGSLPGVAAVGTTHVLPVNDTAMTVGFDVEGRPPASADESLNANFRKVTPGFFRALRVPLIAGRVFDESDDEQHPPVAVVSQEMVRRFWPNSDPVGTRIKRKMKGGDLLLTVVGVVGDVQDGVPGTKFGNTFYIPFMQDPKSNKPSVHLLVRTWGQPLDLAPAIARQVLAVDSDQPLDKVGTVDEWVSSSLSKRRFSAWILTLFAALGIVLSLVGIYGVLSYSVSQRQHEIGVRLALGAQAGDVVRAVLWQGISLTGIGIIIGLALAVASTRLLVSLLYEVKPGDPAIFAGVIVGLTAVALFASYVPARRAARIDPIVSLKQE